MPGDAARRRRRRFAALKAEAGDLETARRRFEQALQLREQLGDEAAIRSTRAALAELDAWCEQRRPSSSV